MLLTRRKRKDQKQIAVYMNNKAIPQVNSLKYLGIIFYYNLTLKEQKNVAEKCNILLIKICKAKLAIRPQSPKDNICRRNPTPTSIWSASVDQRYGEMKL